MGYLAPGVHLEADEVDAPYRRNAPVRDGAEIGAPGFGRLSVIGRVD